MKENLKNLVLVVSLILNILFLGGALYMKSASGFSAERSAATCSFLSECRELNLSKAQIDRVEPIRDRFHRRMEELGGRIKGGQLDLIDLLAANDLDYNAVNTVQETLLASHQTMQDAIISHLLEEAKVFNPDQRKAFFKLLKDRIDQTSRPCPSWVGDAAGEKMAVQAP